jgi:S-adenosylmethionine hydrolase
MNRRSRFFSLSLLLAVLFACACSRQPAQKSESASSPAPRPFIVFMTDFGTANDSVAICKAVIASIAPSAPVMDITHQVTPFSIEEGARFLAGVSPYYPPGTIFLAVVDPGVGTSRKAVIVKTKKGQYFVLPDNGLITPVLERDGLDTAREISNQNWMLQSPLSSTFHGRDVFSPAAAHLAAGWEFNLVGPVVTQLVRLSPRLSVTDDKGITGEVIALDDPYGSLITDIPGDEFRKLGYELSDKVLLQLDKKPVILPFVRTFMDVAVGEPLLYIDSRNRVSLAANQRNFSQLFKVSPPAAIFIPRKGAPLAGGRKSK